jgi:hypothetical protein
MQSRSISFWLQSWRRPLLSSLVALLLSGYSPDIRGERPEDLKKLPLGKLSHSVQNAFRGWMYDWHPAFRKRSSTRGRVQVYREEALGGAIEMPVRSWHLRGTPRGLSARLFLARGPQESGVKAVYTVPLSDKDVAELRQQSKEVTNQMLPHVPNRLVAVLVRQPVQRVPEVNNDPSAKEAPVSAWRQVEDFRVRIPVTSDQNRRQFETQITRLTYAGSGEPEDKRDTRLTIEVMHRKKPKARRGVQAAADVWVRDRRYTLDGTTGMVAIEAFGKFPVHHRQKLPRRIIGASKRKDSRAVLAYLETLGHRTALSQFESATKAWFGRAVAWPQSTPSKELRKQPHWSKQAAPRDPKADVQPMRDLFDPEAARWLRAAISWVGKMSGHPLDQARRAPGKVAVRDVEEASIVPIRGRRLTEKEVPSSHRFVWLTSPGPTDEPLSAKAMVAGLPFSQDQLAGWLSRAEGVARRLLAHISPLAYLLVTRKAVDGEGAAVVPCSDVVCTIWNLRQKPGGITRMDQTDVWFGDEPGRGRFAEVYLLDNAKGAARPDIIPDEFRQPNHRIRIYAETGVAVADALGVYPTRRTFRVSRSAVLAILAARPLGVAREIDTYFEREEKRLAKAAPGLEPGSGSDQPTRTALGRFALSMQATFGVPVVLSSRKDLPGIAHLLGNNQAKGIGARQRKD